MDRQKAFLVLVLFTMIWSASGAPPVDRADRNSEPEREAKTYGGSLTRCVGQQNGSHFLTNDTFLALIANLEKDVVPVPEFARHPGSRVSVRVTIKPTGIPALREGP